MCVPGRHVTVSTQPSAFGTLGRREKVAKDVFGRAPTEPSDRSPSSSSVVRRVILVVVAVLMVVAGLNRVAVAVAHLNLRSALAPKTADERLADSMQVNTEDVGAGWSLVRSEALPRQVVRAPNDCLTAPEVSDLTAAVVRDWAFDAKNGRQRGHISALVNLSPTAAVTSKRAAAFESDTYPHCGALDNESYLHQLYPEAIIQATTSRPMPEPLPARGVEREFVTWYHRDDGVTRTFVTDEYMVFIGRAKAQVRVHFCGCGETFTPTIGTALIDKLADHLRRHESD
ncbi:MAG: hypothetical protein QOJ00_372 [Actinomycetota bacterium]|jgi:hypothetical protein